MAFKSKKNMLTLSIAIAISLVACGSGDLVNIEDDLNAELAAASEGFYQKSDQDVADHLNDPKYADLVQAPVISSSSSSIIVTPPSSSSVIITPPSSSSVIITPPSSSSVIITPPSSSSEIITPPSSSSDDGGPISGSEITVTLVETKVDAGSYTLVYGCTESEHYSQPILIQIDTGLWETVTVSGDVSGSSEQNVFNASEWGTFGSRTPVSITVDKAVIIKCQ